MLVKSKKLISVTLCLTILNSTLPAVIAESPPVMFQNAYNDPISQTTIEYNESDKIIIDNKEFNIDNAIDTNAPISYDLIEQDLSLNQSAQTDNYSPSEKNEYFITPEHSANTVIDSYSDLDISAGLILNIDEVDKQYNLSLMSADIENVLSYSIDNLNVTITDCNVNATSEQVASGFEAIQNNGYKIISIGNGAFNNCNNLTIIRIPNNVVTIEDSAFQNCGNLTEVTLSNSVSSIGLYAFEGCPNLTKVKFGVNISSVGIYAFRSSNKLAEMVFTGPAAPTFYTGYYNSINSVTIAYVPRGTASGYEDKNFGGIVEYDDEDIGIKWDFNENTGKLTFRGYGRMGNYTYQQYVPWQAYLPSVTSVEICEGVQNISPYAFYMESNTNLINVKISNTVDTIGTYAFYGCSKIVKIDMPSTINSIGTCAFFGCSNLDDINIPNSLTCIPDYAFYGCAKLSEVQFPDNVTSIGSYAFESCPSLIKVTFGTGISSIGINAFRSSNKLAEMVFTGPAAPTFYTDYYNSINSVTIAYVPRGTANGYEDKNFGGIVEYEDEDIGIKWNYDGKTSKLTFSGYGRMGNYAYQQYVPWQEYLPSVTSVEIGEGVQNISPYAFYMESTTTNLINVKISNTVDTIGTYAFYGCSRIVKIDMPNSINSIGTCAFYGCSNLADINIPNTLTSIPDFAFYGCAKLIEINLPENVTTIGAYAFESCSSLIKVTFGTSISSIGINAFRSSNKLAEMVFTGPAAPSFYTGYYNSINSVTIAYVPRGTASGYADKNFGGIVEYDDEDIGIKWQFNELTGKLTFRGYGRMGNYAYQQYVPWQVYLPSVTSVEIGEGVQNISPYAFYMESTTTNLTNVKIPNTTDTIGAYAFYGCTKIVKIDLPSSIYSIGTCAFYGCSNLADINIPNTLTSIPDFAFYGCAKLIEINLPENVTTIGAYAFDSCPSLIKVTFGTGISSIGMNAFRSSNKLAEMVFTGPAAPTFNTGYYNSINSVTIAYVPRGTANGYEDKNFGGIIEYKDEDIGIKWQFNELTGKLIINGYGMMGNYSYNDYIPWREYFNSIVSVEIWDGVQSIAPYAFFECVNLKKIDMPSKALIIGSYAFYNNNKLTDITLPDGLTAIGDYAFYGCTNLKNIYFKTANTDIGTYAFYNCVNAHFTTPKYSLSTIYAIDNCISFDTYPNNIRDIPTKMINRDLSVFNIDYSSLKSTGQLIFNTNYRVFSLSNVSDSKVNIVFSQNLSFTQHNTVLINGVACDNYTYNAVTRTLTIPVVIAQNKISVTVIPTDSTCLYAYASFECKLNGNNIHDIIGIVYEENPAILSLITNDIACKPSVVIKGIAPNDSDIDFFINGKYITTTKSNKVGLYKTNIVIPNNKQGVVYTFRVEVAYGSQVLYAEADILYDEASTELEEFILYQGHGNIYDLYDAGKNGIIPVLFIYPVDPWVFTIGFSNPDIVQEVYVLAEKGEESHRIQAIRDLKTNKFIASDYLDPNNHNFFPTMLSVEYYITDTDEYFCDWAEFFDNMITKNLTPEHNMDIAYLMSVNANDPIFDNLSADLVEYFNKHSVDDIIKGLSSYDKELGEFVKDLNASYDHAELLMNFMKIGKDYEVYKKYIKKLIETVEGAQKSFYIDACTKALDSLGAYNENVLFAYILGILRYGGTGGLGAQLPTSSAYLINLLTTHFIIYNSGSNLNYISATATLYGLMNPSGNFIQDIYLPITMDYYFNPDKYANDKTIYNPERNNGVPDYDSYKKWKINQGGKNNGGNSNGSGSGNTGKKPGQKGPYTQGNPVNPIGDPSGFVYEAVISNRINDVKATAWWIPDGESLPKLWNANEYMQINPQFTDWAGQYAWFVPEGMWQVRFEKDGYQPTTCEWLPVPPPQLDVNVGMISYNIPEICWFNVYDTYAEVEFTKYLIPETVSSLKLKSPGGVDVVYSIDYPDDEKSLDGTIYAKRYKLIYNVGYTAVAGSYSLITSSDILSYAGIPVKIETKTNDLSLPISIITPEKIILEYGSLMSVKINLENYNFSKPMTFTAESDFRFITEIKNISSIGSNGEVIIQISGNLPGNANIIFRIAETGVVANVPVQVIMSDVSVNDYNVEDLSTTSKAEFAITSKLQDPHRVSLYIAIYDADGTLTDLFTKNVICVQDVPITVGLPLPSVTGTRKIMLWEDETLLPLIPAIIQ